MDLLRLTRLEEILSDENHFHIDTVGERGRDMISDLRHRLLESHGMVWRVALLAGKSNDEPKRATGMILLEPHLDPEHFSGVYYRHANCGDKDQEASLTTARMLLELDNWYDEEALQRTVMAFDRLRISKLGRDNQPSLPELRGPSIEPIF